MGSQATINFWHTRSASTVSRQTIITKRAKQSQSVRGLCFRHGFCILCNKDFPYCSGLISYISYWTLCPSPISLHLSPTPHAHGKHTFIELLLFTATILPFLLNQY